MKITKEGGEGMKCIILMYFINEFHPVPLRVKIAIWFLYIANIVLSYAKDWSDKQKH